MPRRVDHLRSIPTQIEKVKPPEVSDLRKTAISLKDTDPKKRIPQLDLHGIINPLEAASRIRNFLLMQQRRGETVCRIVHGVGSGLLAEMTIKVLESLKSEGLVEEFSNSQHSDYRLSAKLIVLKENS